MSKRFIVLHSRTTSEQDTAFQSWLRNSKLGWWHWLTEGWLLTDTTDSWTATDIRDKLMEFFPGVRTVIFEIRGEDTWAGFGPKSANQDMFKWLRETWNRVRDD